jgi:uncharacterized protein YjbI with pentapeptide repeats
MSNTYSQNLTFSLVNKHARDNSLEMPPFSVLYKGLSEVDHCKNDCNIVLGNVSETHVLPIPAGAVIHVYWTGVLGALDERSLNWSQKKGWTIEFFENNIGKKFRYWKLIANNATMISHDGLTFQVSGIKASPAPTPLPLASESSKDVARLSFELYLPDKTSVETACSLGVVLKTLDESQQDGSARPINVEFTEPRNPSGTEKWNVRQNQVQLFHPNKGINEVYSNTINALIESRLGFSISNPGNAPLVRKSAKADPRFVVSIGYGNNVRALSRIDDNLQEESFSEENLPEDILPFTHALRLDGCSDCIGIPARFNSTDAITVAIWARSATNSSMDVAEVFMSKWSAFCLFRYGRLKTMYFLIQNREGEFFASFDPEIDISEWHHYAATYDGRKLVLYIDGQECASVDVITSMKESDDVLVLGAQEDASSYFNGELALACIANKACSPEEVQKIMGNQYEGNEDEIIGYYPLNQINEDCTVTDLSPNRCNGLVKGNPTVVPVSSSISRKGGSEQGIELIDDGLDNSTVPIADTSGIAFTQTESDSAGIKTWTLRPPKGQEVVLNSQHTLRWVFNGICPDDNIGNATVTIAFYDIKGYKDGYVVMSVKKVRPQPFLISPRPAQDVVLKSPPIGVSLSWQFFGIDQITILHKCEGKQIAKVENLPAIAKDCTIKFENENLWQDQQLAIDLTSIDGGILSYIIANVTYVGPFSVPSRSIVYRSDWKRLTGVVQRILRIVEYVPIPPGKPEAHHKVMVTHTKVEARVNERPPNCRYSLRRDGLAWILSLEIYQPDFSYPSHQKCEGGPFSYKPIKDDLERKEIRVGGGFFPLEDISFPADDGRARFKVTIEHDSLEGLFTSRLEGCCWVSSGELVFDDAFFKALSFNNASGKTPLEPYCLFPSTLETAPRTPLQAGKNRPSHRPKYGNKYFGGQVQYDSIDHAISVATQIHGGFDGSSTTNTVHFRPGNDLPGPGQVLSSRTLETQDFQDKTLHDHDFSDAEIDQANFNRADLQGANFARASLRKASLQGAKLIMVDGSAANLRESNLVDALLNYAKFQQASFESANLSGASCIGANLTAALFIGANLTGVNFDAALVEGAVFDTACGLSAKELESLQQRGAVVVESSGPLFSLTNLDLAPDPGALA